MKEEHIKKLIGKSKVETSDEFLNTLMHKVSVESAVRNKTKLSFPVKTLLSVCSLLIIIISFLGYSFLNSSRIEVGSSTTPLFIMAFGILLYVLNNFIRSFEVIQSKE